MSDHNPFRLAVIIITFIIFLITVIINAFSASVGVKIGLFLNNTGDISAVFDTEITPAGWTFSIWGFIYAWQTLFLLYSLSTLCRKKSGALLYKSMNYLPPVVFFFYSAANCCNVIWLFLWDRQFVIAALPFIALNPFFLYVALFFACRQLVKSVSEMVKAGMSRDVWLTRFFAHNAIAMYATWTTIASLLNLAIVLTYRANVNLDTACTISLAIVAGEVVIWTVLDNTVLDKYTRYTFTPYLVMIVAFSGIISKNFDLETAKRNSIFSAVLLAVAVLATIIKLIVVIYRHIKRPITPPPDNYNYF